MIKTIGNEIANLLDWQFLFLFLIYVFLFSMIFFYSIYYLGDYILAYFFQHTICFDIIDLIALNYINIFIFYLVISNFVFYLLRLFFLYES
jgi:hypothetical protein